jgi:hypothetical protein
VNTYLLVHRQPETYIGTAVAAAAWETWFNQLGSHLVDPGNAVFERTPVGTCGTPLPLGGYTLVTANHFAEAVELAKGCPIIEEGGGVEVWPPHSGSWARAPRPHLLSRPHLDLVSL